MKNKKVIYTSGLTKYSNTKYNAWSWNKNKIKIQDIYVIYYCLCVYV